MRNYSIYDKKIRNRGHELDKMAAQILKEGVSYYICGEEKEIPPIFLERGITYEIINEGQEEGGGVLDDAIVICVSRDRLKYEQARESWRKKVMLENDRFFQGEVFQSIYYTYKLNEIRLDRVEIFLTPFCTLNCEKCISYIPYFKEKKHTSIDLLKSDADILFSKVDYIYKLKLLGGEGFLYPNLIEYIDYLNFNYGHKIDSIRIGTNGTIFPSKEMLQMCKRNNVTIDISDYTGAVPEKCKLEEVVSLLEKEKIMYDVKRTGEQWLDMGFPNVLPKQKSEEQLAEHFYNCAMFCRQFYNNKLYFCCSNFAAVHTGMFPDNENDYFDFSREFTKQELLEFELGFSDLGHTTFCNVCQGCSEEANPMHVEVAKQVKSIRGDAE